MDRLEDRCLLSSEAATWLGQAGGSDYVGTNTSGPDDFVDAAIQLTNLQVVNGQNVAISKVTLSSFGGALYAYDSSNPGGTNVVLVRAAGSTTAMLYLEPYGTISAGTSTTSFTLQYSNGQQANLAPAGGFVATSSASPTLRVAGKTISVQVDGQNGPDLVGVSPNPGSDGQVDYHVTVSNLSHQDSPNYFLLTSTAGYTWWAADPDPGPASLPNYVGASTMPASALHAEFLSSSTGTTGEFYFQPPQNVSLGNLKLTVHYNEEYDKTDSSTQFTIPSVGSDPTSNPPPVSLSNGSIAATWVGPQAQPVAGLPAGSIDVALSGLPSGKAIDSIVLNNSTSFSWVYQAPGASAPTNVSDGTFQLTYVASSDPTKANLYFAPNRNEAGSNLSVRINFHGGTTAFVTFAGGTSNPDLYDARTFPTSPTEFSPTQAANLQSALNTGTNPWIQLRAGTYQLSSPLTLNFPAILTTDPNATVIFQFSLASVATTDPITIKSSHVHLSGFQVTFTGSVLFGASPNAPTAVIGTSNGQSVPLVDTLISGVTFNAPAPGTQDPDTFDAIYTDPRSSGVISNNVFLGQGIMFNGGPWIVQGNNYEGAYAGTAIVEAFTTFQDGHDNQVLNNQIHQIASTGITDRFYYEKQSINTVVSGNDVFGGIGQPVGYNPNDPEVIMNDTTDPYFTGAPSYVSSDGRVLQVPLDRNYFSPKPGFVVSIVSSTFTGSRRWFRIAQVLDATDFLMADPLPATGNYTISINYGYTNNSFTDNTVDLSGMNQADVGLYPGGGQFGTVINDNHFMGAFPLELRIEMTQPPAPGALYPAPDLWAYIPKYDITVDGNVFDDPASVLLYSWPNGSYYPASNLNLFQAAFTNNTFTYSASYLASAPAQIPSIAIGGTGRVNTSDYELTEFTGNDALLMASTTDKPTVVYDNGISGSQAPVALPMAPAAPSTFNATSDATSVQVDLSWSAVTNASGYVIERSPDGKVGWSTIASVNGSTTTYADPNVSASTTYYYRVRAATSVGYSTFTSTASATTIASSVAPPVAVSLNQDDHDYADLPWNPPNPPFGPDGYQDVHIQLTNLPASQTIDHIIVWPYGGGEYIYNQNPAVAQSAAFFRSSGSTTGDLYVQPMANYTNNSFAVDIYYTGATSPVVVYAPVNATGQLPLVAATSLNQDNHDYANLPWNPPNPPFGSDDYQDVHIQLTNLPSQQSVDHITVWPYGGGEYIYNQNPAVAQSAAFFRTSGSTTGDLYVQPMANYTNNAFAVDIYYTGATNPVVVYAQVNADGQLPLVTATSLNQDNHDYANLPWNPPNPPFGPDGYQDVHIQLSNLPSQQTIDHITVWPYGAGEYLYNQNPAVAQSAAFFRSSGSTTGDLYVQPMANYTNNAFAVDIYYTGATNPVVVYAQVNATAQLPMVTALSLNQDNHDYANLPWNPPNPPFGPDGYQDRASAH
jgi:hypothetical protein